MRYTNDFEKIFDYFGKYQQLLGEQDGCMICAVDDFYLKDCLECFQKYCKFELCNENLNFYKNKTVIKINKILDIKFSDYVLKYYKLIVREQKLKRICGTL